MLLIKDNSSLSPAGPDGKLGGDSTRLQEEFHEGECDKSLLRTI